MAKYFVKQSIDYYVDSIQKGDYVFFDDGTFKEVAIHKKGTHIITFEDGTTSDLFIIYDSIKMVFSERDNKGHFTFEFILIKTFSVLFYLTTNCKYHLYVDVVTSFLRGDDSHYISGFKGDSPDYGIFPTIEEEDVDKLLHALVLIGFAKMKYGKRKRIYFYTRKDGKAWKVEWVWYVCYGSNLCLERFMCYITGKANKKYGIGKGEKCKDQTPIFESQVLTIPYEMYFGNHSSTWDNGGVCFLRECKDPNRYAIARAYRITKKQYNHIWKREGKSPSWYGKEINLEPIKGTEAKTFTSEYEHKYVKPSDRYISVLKAGLKECKISYRKIMWYLKSKIED